MIQGIKRRVKRVLINYALRGNNVHCPCCNKMFQVFLPFGGRRIKRLNAQCPNCLSLERHRLMMLYLKDATDVFHRKLSLLHFAPETVYFKVFKAQSNINYTACDLFPEKYPKGTVKVDVTDIRFESNRFDAIFCNHVLEHIPDDAEALSEIFRVLKPGGWAMLQVPIDHTRQTTYEDFTITTPEARKKAFGQIDHVRHYGLDYVTRLKRAGFKVVVDKYIQNFTDYEIFKYGLMSSGDIFIAKKEVIS